jgi:uncharacterized protein DUF4388
MALQGTLKDFGLGDIFQLIGIQRKTGVLKLESAEDSVTIKFLEGQVVGADTKRRSVEGLLGSVLVRTGRITATQLQEALREQKRSLQRLGFVLVRNGMISEDDLIEALRVQSLQIIYRLFRWRAGTYSFKGVDDLDYDERHFQPISAETILMEGARMIDEWPIIERRIRSDHQVFRRSAAAEQLARRVDSIVDRDMDVDLGTDDVGRERPEAERLSNEEREVLSLVDGKRTVEEINDLSSLGEFDTYRVLSELLTRHLVEEVRRSPVRTSGVGARGRRWLDGIVRAGSGAIVLALVAHGAAGLLESPWAPWRATAVVAASEQLRRHASQSRLERIEAAIQVFYFDRGAFPDELDRLWANGYLDPADVLDPWGRPYGYRLSGGGYQIFGWDEKGELRPDLTVSHRFTGVQRVMSSAGAPETASAGDSR